MKERHPLPDGSSAYLDSDLRSIAVRLSKRYRDNFTGASRKGIRLLSWQLEIIPKQDLVRLTANIRTSNGAITQESEVL